MGDDVAGRDWPGLVGRRVVTRVRSPNGLYDVLGDLLAADAGTLKIMTRQGLREVQVPLIVAGGEVPPAATRAARPHRALSVGDLEQLMAEHWQAAEQDWLGGWRLRAHGGFTSRANSVLAIGEPGMPLDVAVVEVEDWYADRGLPPLAATPHPAIDEADAEQLLAAAGAFERAGWRELAGAGAAVLTAQTGELRVPVALPAGFTLHFSEAPDHAWLAGCRYRGEPYPTEGLALLTSAPVQTFASVLDPAGTTVAVARGSLARRWAGLTSLEVDPAHRRTGLARALVAALGAWAWKAGAVAAFVQVAETNLPGLELYTSIGFEHHHSYAYLTPA